MPDKNRAWFLRKRKKAKMPRVRGPEGAEAARRRRTEGGNAAEGPSEQRAWGGPTPKAAPPPRGHAQTHIHIGPYAYLCIKFGMP